jgi:hypothetical protein
MTGEGNGRATVTYEDDETANKAISEYNGKFFYPDSILLKCLSYLDQHIDSIDTVVRVQFAQRRPRNNDNDGGSRGMNIFSF